MNIRVIAITLSLAFAISGCESMNKKPVVDASSEKSIDASIVAAAREVREEMHKIVMLETPVGQGSQETEQSAGTTEALYRKINIDFDGDILVFMKELGETGILDVRVVGKPPARDVVVSLHHKKTPLYKVLEDAGIQIGQIATIEAGNGMVKLNFGNTSGW